MVGFGTDKKTIVTGVEMFRKLLDDGQAGDNVGLLLRGIEKDQIERGMVLAKPGSIKPQHAVRGGSLRPDEGRGRPAYTVLQGYRPQFYFRTTDVTGNVELPAGRGDGDAGRQHEDDDRADQRRSRWKTAAFDDREGGRTVGAGVVTKILKYVQSRLPSAVCTDG